MSTTNQTKQKKQAYTEYTDVSPEPIQVPLKEQYMRLWGLIKQTKKRSLFVFLVVLWLASFVVGLPIIVLTVLIKFVFQVVINIITSHV